MSWWVWLTGICSVGLFLHIWLFVFTHGSAPSGKPYDDFVMKLSSPTGMVNFVRTVFTFGYLKLSFKRFLRYYSQKIWPIPLATRGQKCPNAELVDLDKKPTSVSDFLKSVPKSQPVILNIGSCS